MTKLYKATYKLNVVFFSEEENEYELMAEAEKWAKEEDNNGNAVVNVSEVTSLDDLPPGYSFCSTPWGGDGNHTCSDWFSTVIPKLAKIENLKAEIAKLTEELDSLTAKTLV